MIITTNGSQSPLPGQQTPAQPKVHMPEFFKTVEFGALSVLQPYIILLKFQQFLRVAHTREEFETLLVGQASHESVVWILVTHIYNDQNLKVYLEDRFGSYNSIAILNFNRVTEDKIKFLFRCHEGDLHFSGILACEGNMKDGSKNFSTEDLRCQAGNI